MRLSKVIKKEFEELSRDKGLLLTLVIVPVVLILVFGYTFQADIKNLDTIVIDQDNSEYSSRVIQAIDNSEFFNRISFSGTVEQAKERLKSSDVRAVFHIPNSFESKLKDITKAEISLYLDSSDYTIYNILKGASGEVMKDSMQEIVHLLIEDLETERALKLGQIDEVSARYQIKNIQSEVEDSSEKLQSLKSEVKRLKEKYGRSLEFELNPLIEDVEEIEEDIASVQENVDASYAEVKILKKEFLSSPLDVNKQYLFGEISYFQYLTPAIITLILFFIGVVLTTINIVDERTKKTLFRVAATPLKKVELYGGKFIVFFLIGIAETIYVLALTIFFFDVQIVGNIVSVVFVLLLLMAASLGLGLLMSSIVKTMKQAVMLIPLVVIPSIIISQTFAPIEVMPQFMHYIAYLSPMFYSNVALREIMIKGTSLLGVIGPILILAVYALIALALGILVSKDRID